MVQSIHRKNLLRAAQVVAVLLSLVLYGIPYFFVFITSLKDTGEANLMNMTLPTEIFFAENYLEVVATQNFAILRGFLNSLIITALSILLLTVSASMAGFVLHRRKSKTSTVISMIILTGLMIPPAIVPTIWLMQGIGVYRTLYGMSFVETALSFAFATNLYRSFMAQIPKDLDEAAIIDGCGKLRLFFRIIFPIVKPVTTTIMILTGVTIYNDFVNPLYFLPGAENVTVQLTLYNFNGMYFAQYNLLFAAIMMISIPPLIMFIFFNKQIVAGMTAGAVKG